MTYEKVNELQTEAANAEVAGDFKKAYELQNELATLLPPLIANGVKKSEERRRAKLQQKAVTERVAALGSFVVGGEGEPPKPLPSTATLRKELEDPPPGTCFLSLVEAGSTPVMQVRPGLPDQPDPNQLGTTFLTPLLATSLPSITYHIYSETVTRDKGGWAYFYAKDENKNTHYTLAGYKLHGYQLPRVIFTRASEYAKDLAVIAIDAIDTREHIKTTAKMVGRTMTVLWGATGKTTQVIPDRQNIVGGWVPRRLIWGGKRFVWKEDEPLSETLYEVKKEWADPKSRTGKIADETYERPLVVVKKNFMGSKIGTFTIVGGLDQTFREYLLATFLARSMVEKEGHGNI